MAKIYEVLCDYFTDAHDKENGIIDKTDILLETEDEQKALNEYEYRKAQEGDLENVYMWVEVDGIGEPYKRYIEELKEKMARLAKDLTITLENGQHYIEQNEAWERWAKVVDEYERLGGFNKK